jgi:hypothetical protein
MPPRRRRGGNAPLKERFVIEPIDVDGDNVPDFNKVTKYNSKGNIVSERYVKVDALKSMLGKPRAATNPASAERVVYNHMPANAQDKPVIVKDDTGFGQYVKLGAGVELGRLAVDGLAAGLGELFQ